MLSPRLKKWIIIFFLTLLILPIFPKQANSYSYLNISAEGAVLIDVASGRILYEKNPDQRMRIASLTKIMTAIIAIENGNLNDLVKTSDNAFGTEGSSIYLKRGEKLSLEDMLYGLMLRSGNDAAVAIAEHIGGSTEGFAYLMNEKAVFIGMNNTNFTNPHGLDHEKHYSTPRDMAVLTAYALKNPEFKKIVSTRVKTAPLLDETWDRKWINKNKMLYMYQWADGVKTGYTKLAKRCLSSSATKEGVQLAAITLKAPDDWNDHKKMLKYGFNNYKPSTLLKADMDVGTIKVNNKETYELIADSDFIYPLKEEEKKYISKKINTDEKEMLSNKHVGKLDFYLKNKYIGSIPLKIKEKNTFSHDVIEAWRRILRGE